MNDAGEGNGRRPESAAVTVHRFGTGETVVQVTGELCGNTAAALRGVVTNELMESAQSLALDLLEVTRIDDVGIDALISAAVLAGEADISLCLVAAQGGRVTTALAAAQLTELFEICRVSR
ncbi:MAG: hypothetical protein JWR32_4315 [Mycobacterium sp.]|jgi:anti-anti-sigma factor|nr:hypothetical protein [Mycobacterium sp.]